jgi:hypothetical protein
LLAKAISSGGEVDFDFVRPEEIELRHDTLKARQRLGERDF